MANAVKLRNPNFRSVKVTLGGTVVAGTMAIVESVIGMYAAAGVSGQSVGFITQCEGIVLPKTADTGIDFVVGKKVYWDPSAKTVTDVALNNYLVGYAKEVASATATEVEVDFNGFCTVAVVTQ